MKIEQTIIQKTFVVRVKDKCYYVDYVNSNGQTLALLNRENWEIYDEEHNDLDIYTYFEEDKKRFKEVTLNRKLAKKLIEFCIKHWNDYNPVKTCGKRS